MVFIPCTIWSARPFIGDAAHSPIFPLPADLKARSRDLRRDPTPAERKLWFDFLSSQFEKFSRQKPLGDYVADFYCARHRVVIELDGDSHFSATSEAYDQRRTQILGLQGVTVIRFTNAEVLQQFEGVCARIEKLLATSPTK